MIILIFLVLPTVELHLRPQASVDVEVITFAVKHPVQSTSYHELLQVGFPKVLINATKNSQKFK